MQTMIVYRAQQKAAKTSCCPDEIDSPLPETLRIRIPEGYAYYGLYPETYLEAAKRFFNDCKPCEVVCVGIRSIGTSLSAGICQIPLAQRG